MMNKLDQIREQYPQYKDWSDERLAYGLYKKFYSDKPLAGYAKEIGLDKTKSLSFLKYAAQQGDTLSFNGESQPQVGGKGMGIARGVLQGATFGAGEEVVAGGVAAGRKLLEGDERPIGQIYEQELQRERQRLGQFREEAPVLAYGSEIAGGIAVPLGATQTVRSAAGVGAGLGGFSAAATSEGDMMDRLMAVPVGAAMGAILGGTLQVAGQTVNAQIKSYLSKKAQRAAAQGAKAVDDLKDEARMAYAAAKDAGVSITPEAFDELLTKTIQEASGGRRVSSRLTPKAAGVISEMKDEAQRILNVEGQSLGIDDLDYMRQLASIPAADFQNPAEQRIAGIIQSNIDDFLSNLSDAQISGGSADEAVAALKKARETWSRMRKTEKVEEILNNARTYAGGLESGLRNQISTILRNKKKRAQFSKDEIALLTQIREGTPIGNLIANMSQAGFSMTGGRNVFGGGLAGATGAASAGIGAAVGGPVGAAVALLLEQGATTGVKYVREMSMQNQVQLFRDIVANGLASQVKQANPSAFRILEAAAAAATRGTIAAGDQPTTETIDLMTR